MRSVEVWLRITRAPVAQLVNATTSTIVHTDRLCRYAARMIISGIPGITSARLVTNPSTSSTGPGRYPAIRPSVTATKVATAPATRPTISEIREP